MRIYRRCHYTMGGLWVDYNLESTLPGLFVLVRPTSPTTERIGWWSALMQGLADGFFVVPTRSEHTSLVGAPCRLDLSNEFERSERACVSARKQDPRGTRGRTVDSFHRETPRQGHVDHCACTQRPRLRVPGKPCARSATSSGKTCRARKDAAPEPEPPTRWSCGDFSNSRSCWRDALHRSESCGGTLPRREQTRRGRSKARRRALQLCRGMAYQGADRQSSLHKEPLTFDT